MKANHVPMVRGLPSKTCRCIFDAFVIDGSRLLRDRAPRFMSSTRRNQPRDVFETARTKARSIEVDVLNVCLSKRSLCRLGRLTFEIRRDAPRRAGRRAFRHPFA